MLVGTSFIHLVLEEIFYTPKIGALELRVAQANVLEVRVRQHGILELGVHQPGALEFALPLFLRLAPWTDSPRGSRLALEQLCAAS